VGAVAFALCVAGDRATLGAMGICNDCQWYDGKVKKIDRKGRASGHGPCRRYPPIGGPAAAIWPEVVWDAWCGEFAPKAEEDSTEPAIP
jgi:hypothetical protein